MHQPKASLTTLPPELLDRIFEQIDEPRLLYPFLFSRQCFSSAKQAIYRHLTLTVCDGQGPTSTSLTRNSKFSLEFTLDGLLSIQENVQRIESMAQSQNSRTNQLSSTRSLEIGLLPKQFILALLSQGVWPADFIRYWTSPDLFHDSLVRTLPIRRPWGHLNCYRRPVRIPGVENVNLTEYMRYRMTPNRLGRWMTTIFEQIPNLENLKCDFFPWMWTDYIQDTYDMMSRLQNLQTLYLQGYGSYLDFRLSRLPNLRHLTLYNIQLAPVLQDDDPDPSGVIHLDIIYNLWARSAWDRDHRKRPWSSLFPGGSLQFCLLGFNHLISLRVHMSRRDGHQGDGTENFLYLDAAIGDGALHVCATTLNVLELSILPKWYTEGSMGYENISFPCLNTLIIPWTKLVQAVRMAIDYDFDTSKVQTLEVWLDDQFFPFGHDLQSFLTDLETLHSFPSLRTITLCIREDETEWLIPSTLILNYMANEIAMGFLWGRAVVQSEKFSPGRLELEGGLVIEFFDLMKCVAMHDVNWKWPVA